MHLTVVAQRQDRLDFPGKPGTRGKRESIHMFALFYVFTTYLTLLREFDLWYRDHIKPNPDLRGLRNMKMTLDVC